MALSINTSVANVLSSTTVATTAAFTASANTLILALVSLDAPSNQTTTGAMSDTAGLSWTLAVRANLQYNPTGLGGSVEIWWAITTAGFTSKTVSVTNSSTGGAGAEATEIRVVQFQGYKASPIGATASTDFTTGTTTFTQAITTTANNSWVWGKVLNYTGALTMTANGSTAILSQGDDGDGDEYVTIAQTSASVPPTAASGSNLTLGGTFSTADIGHICLVEILPVAPTATATVAWLT